MSSHPPAAKAICARLAALALVLGSVAYIAVDPAVAEGNLDVLSGTWRGGGTMSFEDGKTEKISCNGYYKGSGSLSIVIRCKGASTNFELRSKLQSNGDKVSGSWEERTYHTSGDATGSASAGKLHVAFSGSLTGSLSMNFTSSSQSVSVSVGTKGAGIKGVSVSFKRD